MKILKNDIKAELNIRTQKNFPKEGIEFIDITPLTIDKKVFNEIIDRLLKEIKDKKIDYIVSPEARGFLFGPIIASKLNIGFIPVRKKGKLPPIAVEKEFTYEKEYGKDILVLPKLIEEEYKNKNFYILDDIYATGNTMISIKEAIKNLKGNVVGEGVIIKIKGFKENKELFSLIEIEEEI